MATSASLTSFDDLKAEVDTSFAKVYDWNSATQAIENFLKTNRETDRRAFELLGDSYYNLAFQQNNRAEFKKVIFRAGQAYGKVLDDLGCKARASYCKYWATDVPFERHDILKSECLSAVRQAMKAEPSARSYSELIEFLLSACDTCSEKNELDELITEAKQKGREGFLIYLGNCQSFTNDAIILANVYLRLLSYLSGSFLNEDEVFQIKRDVLPVINKLVQASGQIHNALARSLAFESGAQAALEFGEVHAAIELIEKAVEHSEETKDRFIRGRQFSMAANAVGWLGRSTDIPENRMEFFEREREYATRAIEELKPSLPGYDLRLGYYSLVEGLTGLSWHMHEVSDKFAKLDLAIEIGREGIGFSPDSLQSTVELRLGDSLRTKARLMQPGPEREQLRSEAVRILRLHVDRSESLIDPTSWNVGVYRDYLGSARSELADDLTGKPDEMEKLLRESTQDLKKSVEITSKSLSSQSKSRKSRVGGFCEDLGNTFQKLFRFTGDREQALDSINAFEKAVEYYIASELNGSAAPLEWVIAKTNDSIGEYEESSRAFQKASEMYELAAKNQKSLQKTFADLSLYMQAWSKIEESRALHRDEDFTSSSKKLAEAASDLLQTEYAFLARHYKGSSKMEEGEDLARREKNQEASEAFALASDLFAQAQQEAARHVNREDDLKWAELSKNRWNYCQARKAIEDAKILDRNAQPEASMRKYVAACDVLKKIVLEAGKGGDVSDVESLALSCEAFATMKKAELKSSPELYSSASELFLRAKESNMKQSFVLSCLANASICDAFEAGTKFKKSGDAQLYTQIKKQLGVASRYYEEAGFEIAADWTGATEALFDALAYLAAAEGEMDSAKKTQMYHLAEKHLELSARRYGDIGYDKKRQEVLKQLKKARENRELLITPMEALSQSPTVSSSPVSFTRDQALGLERFEVANLTGNVSLSIKQTNVGSSIRIDIDIANVGKTPALLMKLESIAPSNSFEPDSEKNQHHFIEDVDSIGVDLKGKRLEYLKAHEMSLHFIAKSKGNYEIKPKVLFVDELGKYRSYEFEAQTVEVKELGFMGWAKGK